MTGTGAIPLPMFPLSSVLLPHMVLPLHIFEPRYRALVHDCLAGGGEFGVALIERGSEVGGGDERLDIGTVARIVEADQLPDGRWALLCIGTRRLRVERWLSDDPYPRALVHLLADPPTSSMTEDALGVAEKAVRRALALAGELGYPASLSDDLDGDASVACYQLVAMAPLGPFDRQRLLEIDEPVERLVALEELACESAAMLAYRLSAG